MAIAAMVFIVALFLAVLVFIPQQEPEGEDKFLAWAYRLWRD